VVRATPSCLRTSGQANFSTEFREFGSVITPCIKNLLLTVAFATFRFTVLAAISIFNCWYRNSTAKPPSRRDADFDFGNVRPDSAIWRGFGSIRYQHFPNALDRRGAGPAISATSVSGDTIPQCRLSFAMPALIRNGVDTNEGGFLPELLGSKRHGFAIDLTLPQLGRS